MRTRGSRLSGMSPRTWASSPAASLLAQPAQLTSSVRRLVVASVIAQCLSASRRRWRRSAPAAGGTVPNPACERTPRSRATAGPGTKALRTPISRLSAAPVRCAPQGEAAHERVFTAFVMTLRTRERVRRFREIRRRAFAPRGQTQKRERRGAASPRRANRPRANPRPEAGDVSWRREPRAPRPQLQCAVLRSRGIDPAQRLALAPMPGRPATESPRDESASAAARWSPR